MPKPAELDLPDRLLASADRALRALFAPARGGRPLPAIAPDSPLPEAERREVAGLMRVNHAGEVSAQGLYHGQALVAGTPKLRGLLLDAAREETDHLAWCEARLRELGDRPSRLGPLWYAGSFGIGVAAGLLGDRASLGFVAETEAQVEAHLDSHLERLPAQDARSRAILEQMRADEITHGRTALESGGAALPAPVRRLMQATARVMTSAAYRF
jgi:ubiquinone biosynthesis monooxygenase Coq7